MSSVGTITIKAENMAFEDMQKYRELFIVLMANSVVNVKNGKAILHFNNNEFAGLEIDVMAWKRNKSDPLAKSLENSTIEITHP